MPYKKVKLWNTKIQPRKKDKKKKAKKPMKNK